MFTISGYDQEMMGNCIVQLSFMCFYGVILDESRGETLPFNNLTYVYHISRKVANAVPIFDEMALDSVIQCGVFCVSNPPCLSAFYAAEDGICMISDVKVDNYFMSPGYQADVEAFGSILYIDLEGWKTPPSSSTTTSTTTSTSTSTSTSTTTPTTTTAGATPIDFVIGDRVKRGPDWSWGDQDGNGEGTISKVVGNTPGWTQVTWDYGYTDDYRNGYEGKVDLIKIS